MKAPSFVIFGGGEHGKVVLDAALRQGLSPSCIVDDAPQNLSLLGHAVTAYGNVDWVRLAPLQFVVAIGTNASRRKVFERLRAVGGHPVSIVHPHSAVAASVSIGQGTVVCAGAVINPEALIGENCIINTAASVDHDCRIGADVHICPGVRLAGMVTVGEGSMIGTGAVVIPGVRIGTRCMIGAGAVVVRDIPDGATAYGNPARVR